MQTLTQAQRYSTFIPSFDPLLPHPDYARDPYPVYEELRKHAPMYLSPHGVWMASRHFVTPNEHNDYIISRSVVDKLS